MRTHEFIFFRCLGSLGGYGSWRGEGSFAFYSLGLLEVEGLRCRSDSGSESLKPVVDLQDLGLFGGSRAEVPGCQRVHILLSGLEVLGFEGLGGALLKDFPKSSPYSRLVDNAVCLGS